MPNAHFVNGVSISKSHIECVAFSQMHMLGDNEHRDMSDGKVYGKMAMPLLTSICELLNFCIAS